jgi:aminopeptidase
MKEPRMTALAENIINYSVELKKGEKILIENIGNEGILTKELIKQAYKAGGVPFLTIKDNELLRVLLNECSEEQIKLTADIEVARMKEMDAYVGIRVVENASELASVPPEKMKIYMEHYVKPLHIEQRVKHTKWCILGYPNHSMAQSANMATDDLRIFISMYAI